MKISNLEIKNYKQFKDLTLDLTYPKGHEKEGEPLDKICIIGQSGTGKTNLLDIIKKSTVDCSGFRDDYRPFTNFIGDKTAEKSILNSFINKNSKEFKVLFTDDTTQIEPDEENKLTENEKNYFIGTKLDSLSFLIEEDSKDLNMSNSDKNIYQGLVSKKVRRSLFNRSAQWGTRSFGFAALGNDNEEDSDLSKINRQIKDIESKYNSDSVNISNYLKKEKVKKRISKYLIDVNNNTESWEVLKARIDKYNEDEQTQKSLLFNKIMVDNDFSKEDSIQEMKNWQDKNENLLENISSDINKILKKFNLELTKINENQKDYSSLDIKDLSNDTIIDYDDLSTGTKNLLSTFIPLKSYSPKDSIILIDEPEMSFYPDVQKKLVDLYKDVGENNQLIVATHSPIIASSFEPWEIVELKFNDNNQIYREDYFEGENHTNNYTLDPRMLTWTGILTDIFDLKEDSNFSVREQGLMAYATLKSEIKMTKNIKEKENKFKELQKLSKKLGLDN